ncbi:hypothetical protein B5F40_01980 [Gordonibacter sp. An230]|uniref:hypothetical protein n=1 Tax=Gordonibacter sp. An230 TaxID=1965592 RepID=UPI000B38D90E|nr:hypothetical protein [Gordonibacter sp. An230]OUO92122.1 hypothetical protein B5F40_01980 [Gordonibacter sp. An230]
MVVPAVAAAALAAGGAAGWFAVLPLADRLLGRSYARAASWWWESCEAYTAFKRGHRAREPCADAGGEEGMLAVWRDDALAAAREGSLSRERAAALAAAGCDVDVSLAVCDEAALRERRAFSSTPLRRGICAFGCALWFLALIVADLPATVVVAFAVCGVAMAAAVACDVRARIIPIEACAAIGMAGVVAQMRLDGMAGLAAGTAFAALVIVGCVVANRTIGHGEAPCVGRGDVRCMAALSIASGFAAPSGMLACYVIAAAVSLAGMAAKRLTAKDGIPMAPFLAVWLLVASLG